MNTRTKYQVKYLQQRKEKKTTEKDQEGYNRENQRQRRKTDLESKCEIKNIRMELF